MEAFKLCFVCVALLVSVVRCARFPFVVPKAIFGLTDSISDPGNAMLQAPNKSMVPSSQPPYGKSLDNTRTGRFCDGLLIIDFLAQHIGYPSEIPIASLSPDNATFQTIGFGSAGTTVTPQPFPSNPDILPLQVEQFLQYKANVINANPQAGNDFLNALYYIEIGGNDINYAFNPLNMTFDQVKQQVVPSVIQGLVDSITTLHMNGSLHFLIFNMPAAGCSPLYLTNFYGNPYVTHDNLGCILEANEVVEYFNAKLRDAVYKMRCKYPMGNFMLFDFYQANLDILREHFRFGFKYTREACCGKDSGPYHCSGGWFGCGCGLDDLVGCQNPDEYISWDGAHYTQHFYKLIAEYILNRIYLDPPVPIYKAPPMMCDA